MPTKIAFVMPNFFCKINQRCKKFGNKRVQKELGKRGGGRRYAVESEISFAACFFIESDALGRDMNLEYTSFCKKLRISSLHTGPREFLF